MKRISKWEQGVNDYADWLKSDFKENYGREKMTEEKLLNGAKDWKEYSWSGNALIYDDDIAEKLATPSELKRARGKSGHVGSWANKKEQWLDVQARALYQASRKLLENRKRSQR